MKASLSYLNIFILAKHKTFNVLFLSVYITIISLYIYFMMMKTFRENKKTYFLYISLSLVYTFIFRRILGQKRASVEWSLQPKQICFQHH